MNEQYRFVPGELDKQQNAAVWQKKKDHVPAGGGHGGRCQDGRSVQRISSENFLEREIMLFHTFIGSPNISGFCGFCVSIMRSRLEICLHIFT